MLQVDNRIGFRGLIDKQADRHFGPVRTHKDELKDFSDLRNAIVHNPRREGKAIAEPRADTVARIKELRDLIFDPPKVHPRFSADVTVAHEDESVGSIIQDMQNRNFSQVPVLDQDDQVIGLLTTNTIARWVGGNIERDEDGGELLLTDTTTVAHIQEYAERTDNYTFLSRGATLFEAAEEFRIEPDDYGPIDAVLITQNGRPGESLLGIITMADLPAIHRKL